MRQALALLLMFAVTSCVTTSPSSPRWSNIEGCWGEPAEFWPAYMTWRRDPAHPGGYIGHWQREAAQMDIEEVHFTLAPVEGGMQLCQQLHNGSQRCDPAMFGRGGWRRDGVAVFDVRGDYHEFGYAGATMPFFWGNRRDCG